MSKFIYTKTHEKQQVVNLITMQTPGIIKKKICYGFQTLYHFFSEVFNAISCCFVPLNFVPKAEFQVREHFH